MSANVTELMFLVFKTEDSLKEAKSLIKAAEKEKEIEVINAAEVSKDLNGKVSYKELEDLRYRKKGRLVGAGAGAILGLLGGPAGLLITTALGTLTGDLVSRLKDKGVPNETLKAWSEELEPGTFALVVLVEHIWVDQLIQEVADQTAQVMKQQLEEDASTLILTVAEEGEPVNV